MKLSEDNSNWVFKLPDEIKDRLTHIVDDEVTHLYPAPIAPLSPEMTLFLSNQEIKSIKSFYYELGVNPSHLFNFDGVMYCGRTYVEVIGTHDTLIIEEDGARVKGLGKFYPEDEQ